MNTTRHYERLDELWTAIDRLEGVVVECERDTASMTGDEAASEVRVARELQARIDLDRLRREHGILAHFLATALRPKEQRAA